MNFKKNVIWQMSKNKKFTCHDLIPLSAYKQFFAQKNKKNMDSYSKLSKNCKEFKFFEISQIVTGKNANKSKFKASGQTGLRRLPTGPTTGKQR